MNNEERAKVILDDAVAALRASTADEQLTDARRTAIFAAVQAVGPASPWESWRVGFRRWWAVAALVPLTLVLGLAIWQGGAPGGEVEVGEGVTLHASKIGDRVVFDIANGNRDHLVQKSGSPDRFDARGGELVTEGAFVDRLDSGADLVYYRVG